MIPAPQPTLPRTAYRSVRTGEDVQITCNRGLSIPPPPPSQVHIYVDKVEVYSIVAPASLGTERFDTHLGYLTAGTAIRVAINARKARFNDNVIIDFNIVLTTRLETLGRFVDGLSNPPGPNWRFLTNTDVVSNPSNFRQLVFNAGMPGFAYSSSAYPGALPYDYVGFDTLRKLVRPGRFLDVSGTTGSDPLKQVYAVAAFTIPTDGMYFLANSYIVDENPTGIDGNDIRVMVNSELKLLTVNEEGENTHGFNVALGSLSAGDVVYVCFGNNLKGGPGIVLSADFTIDRLSDLA